MSFLRAQAVRVIRWLPDGLWKLLRILLASYLGVCLFMYVQQRSLLYSPTGYSPTPEVNNDLATVMTMAVNGEQIKLWQLNAEQDNAILYFGGNAENVAQNIEAYSQQFPQHAVYLVNYRGYGGSSGSPSEEALLTDAMAIFDQLSQQHQSITVIGRSLGSGVAVHLAVTKAVHKLVLITPYDSIAAVAKQQYFWLPVSLLLKDSYDSLSKAPQLNLPVLVISAEYDKVIPFQHTANLMRAIAPDLLQAKTLLGAQHNNIHQTPSYFPILLSFIELS